MWINFVVVLDASGDLAESGLVFFSLLQRANSALNMQKWDYRDNTHRNNTRTFAGEAKLSH